MEPLHELGYAAKLKEIFQVRIVPSRTWKLSCTVSPMLEPWMKCFD